MKFLLDTNTVNQIIAGHHGLISSLYKYVISNFAISSVADAKVAGSICEDLKAKRTPIEVINIDY
ncbi:MAG: hypothetical protein OXE56_09080 [Gammaproteobacteria bacterium]|nr:hypothetical protein [Gammaproteobacteria bacterium]